MSATSPSPHDPDNVAQLNHNKEPANGADMLAMGG